jgi:hypothetical protein
VWLASWVDQRSGGLGANSGRQRKQGLKPAPSAWAGWVKNWQFFCIGVRALHTGRQ